MPIPKPAAATTGNDLKFPRSAAASAGTIRSELLRASRATIWAEKIMASPASDVAIIQLTAANRSGLSPASTAPFWFSEAAVVARPNRVWRLTSHSSAARTATMAPSSNRSTPTSRPSTVTLSLGRSGRTFGVSGQSRPITDQK